MKKISLLILSVLIMLMIVFFKPIQIEVYKVLYPNYLDLLDKGYTHDEIKLFNVELSEGEYSLILQLDYASDIVKQVSDPDYLNLRQKNYTDTEVETILELDSSLVQFYLDHDNLSDQKDLLQHPYFVLDRYERYINYQNNHQDADLTSIIRLVNTNRDYELYSHIEVADTSIQTEVLVNKYYQLPSDYVPDLEETYLGFMMQEEAARALDSMIEAMLGLGLDISISNSYRPYVMQERIYNTYLETQPQSIVDTYSARPGHSEHQAGLAVDFKTQATGIIDFGGSEAYTWLKENAHIYGFIQRYTEENSIYTGYKAEEWHYRYVGADLALIIHDTQLSLEEVLLLYR